MRERRLHDRVCETLVGRPIGERRAKAVDVEWLAHITHDLKQRHVGHGLAGHARENDFGIRKT